MAKADNDSIPTERDWRDVEKPLPASANKDAWLAELDRIRRDKLSPEEYIEIFEARAKQSERLIAESPVTAEEQALLERDKQWSQEQAEHYKRLKGERRRPRRLYAILWLWQQYAGDPLITDKADERANLYLRAATKVVFGKAIKTSTAKGVIRRFRHQHFSAASLRGEGTMSIDDSKVFVITKR